LKTLTDPPTTSAPDAALAAALAAAAEPGTHPEAGLAAAQRALVLAGELGRAAEQAQAEAWVCVHLSRMGQHAQTLARVRPLLPRLAAPGLEGPQRELLRYVTLSAGEIGAFDVALDAAHALSQASRRSDRPDDALAASFLLAVCLERMGDSWQALRLLGEALAAYGSGAPSHPLLVAANGVCAISLGMAHRLRDTGADDEIRAMLANGRAQGERALALLQQVPGDTYDVAVPGNLGETLLLQGELALARPLLMQAMELAQTRGLKAHIWRVRTSLADWHLAAGDAERARHLARGLIGEMGEQAPQQTAIRAHDAAYRACRALGLHEEALGHLETAERTERQRTTSQLRSQSQLFVTRTEAEQARAQADLAHADAAWQRQRAAEYAAAAERDVLTGLGNRRHLERRCAELLPVLAAEGQPLSLALLDIDHFKQVNDQHGHTAGDQVLVHLAQLLRENTRGGDVLARHGGEEFVIVLPGMELPRAAEVCERLRERVAAYGWPVRGGLTISIGLAASPPWELAPLLQRADEALYRAKASGRNSVKVGPQAR
jgi:diguanylate cyclase